MPPLSWTHPFFPTVTLVPSGSPPTEPFSETATNPFRPAVFVGNNFLLGDDMGFRILFFFYGAFLAWFLFSYIPPFQRTTLPFGAWSVIAGSRAFSLRFDS